MTWTLILTLMLADPAVTYTKGGFQSAAACEEHGRALAGAFLEEWVKAGGVKPPDGTKFARGVCIQAGVECDA